MPARAVRAILVAGLVAGILDITGAFAFSALRGGTPMAVLRFVASGLLGPAARQGGVGLPIALVMRRLAPGAHPP